nr:MAG TPA: hypothetical protein [Caudoviricetes sp.]DAL22214.1 MAG TPA_asm: hypothetical protein [Caudoviricetes sp.]DAO12449.1 MAG TPA: hypothetical protein [Caudoviricetes sp.]
MRRSRTQSPPGDRGSQPPALCKAVFNNEIN